MKKILRPTSILAIAASIACCTKADFRTESRTVTFTASVPNTRTQFAEPSEGLYPVIWTAADKEIAVSLNLGTPQNATVTPSPDGRTATFKAQFPESESSYMFAALSPASALSSFDAAAMSVSYSIPAVQSPLPSSPDPAAQILLGLSETSGQLSPEVKLHFSHLTAYARLTLTGLDLGGAVVNSVSLSCDGAMLNGNVSYNAATGQSTVTGNGTVTAQTSSLQDVWFGINPSTVSGKPLTVSLRTGDGTYTKTITVPDGKNFEAGKVAKLSVDMSDAALAKPDRSSISILAVGNSFSVDAMQYLYDVLKQLGYKNICLGNLYIGGCSLQTHAGNMKTNSAAYTYYTNTTGSWSSKTSGPMTALRSRNWDYVSVQQVSQGSGKASTYEPYLSAVVDSIKSACPHAKLIWHMTWPYQHSSNYSQFANYDYDQKKMYDGIVDAVKTVILPRGDFSLVIPSGTAIQNLRTSFIGDAVSRDGYHLDYNKGRLTAAITWAKALTGASLNGVNYVPTSYSGISSREYAAIREAVDAAIRTPYEVTQASDKDGGYEPNTALRALLQSKGYDLDKYNELPYSIRTFGYYNSTTTPILRHKDNGQTDSNLNQFSATGYFDRNDLPDGTLLVLASGYQYRPEGWTQFKTINSSSARPGNVTTQIVTVNSAWWGSWNYRAFNLAKDGHPGLSAAELESLRTKFAIFVPK